MGLMDRDRGQIEAPVLPLRDGELSELVGAEDGGGQAPGRGGVTARTGGDIDSSRLCWELSEPPRVSVMIYYWMVNCQIAAAPIDVAGARRDRTL